MGGRGTAQAKRNTRSAIGTTDVLSDAEIKQIAGEKGISDSVQGAAERTNPHYSEDEKWRYNCQRCVIAYEMRRRGYDVEAKPFPESSDTLAYGDHPRGWRHVFDGTENARLENTPKVKLTEEDKAQAEEAGITSGVARAAKRLGAQMKKWGTGARAMAYVAWKNGTGAHVFIAEQTSEGTKYVDPQDGRMLAVGDYLSKAILEKTELIRIDQAKPTGLLAEAVQKREKEKK